MNVCMGHQLTGPTCFCEQACLAHVGSISHRPSSHQLFPLPQAKVILESFSEGEEKLEAALIIFTRLDPHSKLEGLSQWESKWLAGRLGVLGAFRADNPTGHYELSLSSVSMAGTPMHP